jgi:hypothetical protein
MQVRRGAALGWLLNSGYVRRTSKPVECPEPIHHGDKVSVLVELEMEPYSQHVGNGARDGRAQARVGAAVSRIDAEKYLTEPRDIRGSELRRGV